MSTAITSLVADLRESAAYLVGQGADGDEGGAHYRLADHNVCGRCSGRWPCVEASIGLEARQAADHIECLNWCIDHAINLIESGREWDAVATLQTAISGSENGSNTPPPDAQ